jgi:hypothetical protein
LNWTPDAGFRWWIEGSADYMSNVVYPTNNEEWGWEERYDPTTPIFEQAYATSLFFQWMESTGSPQTINTFVSQQTFSADIFAEMTRLSTLDGFDDLFLSFMEADQDYYIENTPGTAPTIGIEDTDGDQIVPELSVPWTVIPSPELDPSATFTIDLINFTGNLSVISLDQGQTVAMSYDSPQPNVQIVYKTDPTDDWAPLSNDDTAPVSLDIPCGDSGMPVYFLTVSTDDETFVEATITVTQTNVDCNCNPGDYPGSSGSNTPVVVRRQSSSSGSNSCPVNPSNPSSGNGTINTCLYGNWNLDLPQMENLIAQVEAQYDQAATVSNIQLSGTASFAASSDNVANFTFSSLTISMDIDIDGFGTTSASAVINGDVDATLIYVSASEVSLELIDASGSVAITTSITSEPITVDIGDYFVPEGLVIQYNCSSTSLTMTGIVGAEVQTDWVYYWNSA